MKKFITLLLTLIYITASSGVVLNVHYCMGKVSKITIDNFSPVICKCGNTAKTNSCCRSEFKVVKLSDLHKELIVATQTAFFVAFPLSNEFVVPAKITFTCKTDLVDYSPPDYTAQKYTSKTAYLEFDNDE